MTVEEKIINRTQEISANATELERYWKSIFPADAPTPSPEQFELWARIHRNDISAILDGIDECIGKYLAEGGAMDLNYVIRYTSKCANQARFRKAA